MGQGAAVAGGEVHPPGTAAECRAQRRRRSRTRWPSRGLHGAARRPKRWPCPPLRARGCDTPSASPLRREPRTVPALEMEDSPAVSSVGQAKQLRIVGGQLGLAEVPGRMHSHTQALASATCPFAFSCVAQSPRRRRCQPHVRKGGTLLSVSQVKSFSTHRHSWRRGTAAARQLRTAWGLEQKRAPQPGPLCLYLRQGSCLRSRSAECLSRSYPS